MNPTSLTDNSVAGMHVTPENIGKSRRFPHKRIAMPLKMITWALVILQIETAVPVFGATAEVWRRRASESHQQRTVQEVQEPAPIMWRNEEEAQIMTFKEFADPLLPVGKTSRKENEALIAALKQYSQRTKSDDFSALQQFLSAYPHSAWSAALLTRLGSLYKQSGYLTRAIKAWGEAWELTHQVKSGPGKLIADRAGAEFLRLNSTVGRCEVLEPLLKEFSQRDVDPAVNQEVFEAREALQYMHQKPELSFLCGPLALSRVRMAMGTDPRPKEIDEARSTPHGLNLTYVKQLSDRLGMGFQMAKRSPGAAILVPAVVHWKAGHFAAIVKEVNGLYRIQDLTGTGEDVWISAAALDDEGTGYYLVRGGTLPSGWQAIDEQEGSQVWGRGKTYNMDNKRRKKSDPKCNCPKTEPPLTKNQPIAKNMAEYNVHAMTVSLSMVDTPIGYAATVGPQINFTLHYSQREDQHPTTFNYSNVGKLWTFDWLSYVVDNDSNPAQNVTIYQSGGGQEDFIYDSGTGKFQTQYDSVTVLTRTGTMGSPTYTLEYPDGSQLVFSAKDGGTSQRKVFLTQIKDAAGNAVTLSWDSNNRLTQVQDAVGRITTIGYLSTTFGSTDYYKISTITDPFGRQATLTYTAASGGDTKQLKSITDQGGIVSSFVYGAGGFITAMTTPYGTTKFATGDSDDPANDPMRRWLEVTDPLGQKERTEFHQFEYANTPIPQHEPTAVVPVVPVVPGGLQVHNDNLNFRNTFFWSKSVMQKMGANLDYSKAHIYHWLHVRPESNAADLTTSGDLESEKDPLENRVWYLYPGQTDAWFQGTSSQPSMIAQVLASGETQVHQYTYNDLGHATQYIDPVGRVTWYNYFPNGEDLKEIRQGGATSTSGDLLVSLTYDSTYTHQVKTVTDAARETTTFNYGTWGKVLSISNPKSEVTSFTYDTRALAAGTHPGFLTQMDGAISDSRVTFVADGFDRIQSVTSYIKTTTGSAESFTISSTYDNFDRLTQITYPDNTTEKVIYNKLDAVLTKDRLGRWTGTEYDPLRRPVAVKDSLGQVTKYQWCSCGALESIVDPMGRVTTWMRDWEDREIGKVFPDGTQINYAYDLTGRLTDITDAKSQTTHYVYNKDDTLKQLTYLNPVVATPGVSFTYDPIYNRVLTMTDGTGTSTNVYNPVTGSVSLGAGQLATVTTPFTKVATSYTYDELGRRVSRSVGNINETASTETVSYDALGRVQTVNNDLGTTTMAYTGARSTPDSITYPGSGGLSASFTYYGASDTQNHGRMQRILNSMSSGTVSQFDYQYDATGQITTWSRLLGTSASYYTFQYDPVNQLLGAVLTSGTIASPGSVLNTYGYNYDSAGNRLSEFINSPATTTTSGYNNLNQLVKRVGGERRTFSGTLSAASKVTLNGVPATMNQTDFKSFSGDVSVSSESNIVTVVALGTANKNSSTNRYQVTVSANGTPKTLTYDLNGNLVSAVSGSTVDTYEWDAADQLLAIEHRTSSAPGTRSEFAYDGLGRRIQIIERAATGTITSQKLFVWDGLSIIQQRDGNTILQKRYFNQGMMVGSSKYLYTRDHLGSIREMVTTLGTLVARYDYDLYGRRGANQVTSGAVEADFGFTGHYYHNPSGLHLAPFRAYDADTGRWISRDPIAERGGLNLYAYCNNDPINSIDLDGLFLTGVDEVINGVSLGLDAKNLGTDLGEGNYGGAAVDALTTVLDLAAALLPGDPVEGSGVYLNTVRQAEREAAQSLRRLEDAELQFAKRAANKAANKAAAKCPKKPRSPYPIAERNYYSTRKAAREAAEKASPIGKAVAEKHPGGYGPHYHPLDKNGKQTHDHYYFPDRFW